MRLFNQCFGRGCVAISWLVGCGAAHVEGEALLIELGTEATAIERTGAELLTDAWKQHLHSPVDHDEHGNSRFAFAVGTPASSEYVRELAKAWDLASLGDEGFIVRPHTKDGNRVTVVAANSGRGVLYGCAAFVDAMKLGTSCDEITLREVPKLAERNLWIWNGPRMKDSAFFSMKSMANVEKEPRYQELGRYLAHARINALTLWATRPAFPDGSEGVGSVTETYRTFTRYFRERYGVDVAIFLVYEIEHGSQMPIHGWPVCPFDERVRTHWHDQIEQMKMIPDLRGLIMAGAGGDWVRGPWECSCEQCRALTDQELLLKAMAMIGEPFSKAGGRIIWKAVTDRPTRVTSEVEHFANLDEVLPPYVTISHKNFYKDFRQPHPIHPMFYHHADNPDHERPYLCEFQIYGEYRGGTDFPCVMIDRWAEVFPLLARKQYRGAMAAASIARVERWDHPLNLANWYAFGRLAWNPDESADAIYRDWATLTFGAEVAEEVVAICRMSYQASTKMMFFRGVMTQNHSQLPTIDHELENSLVGPWHDIPKAKDGYWGRGHDVSAYPPEVAEAIRNDPKLVLWAHRVPITPELCDDAIAEKKEAFELVKEMASRWKGLKHGGWNKLHAQVAAQLKRNVVDAEAWYLTSKIYFDFKAGRLTASDLKARIADLRERIDPKKGSRLIKNTFEPCLGEWTRVQKGFMKRVSMPGAHFNRAGEDLLPALMDEPAAESGE